MSSVLQRVLEGYLGVRSYSGRGMNGRSCLGVDAKSLGQFLSVLVEGTVHLENREVRDLAEEVSNIKTDSMGMGMIIYFPGVEYEDECENEKED